MTRAEGQLDDGNLHTNSSLPVSVLGGLSFESPTGGGFHTWGLTTNSDVYCWESNGRGQLGTGDTLLFQSFVPVRVAYPR